MVPVQPLVPQAPTKGFQSLGAPLVMGMHHLPEGAAGMAGLTGEVGAQWPGPHLGRCLSIAGSFLQLLREIGNLCVQQ